VALETLQPYFSNTFWPGFHSKTRAALILFVLIIRIVAKFVLPFQKKKKKFNGTAVGA
jgi:hypothetical protein